MSQYEFIDFEPTEDPKCLGIATIRIFGKLILRFKVIPGKDGKGFFVAPPSVKLKDGYSSAFMLDSRVEEESIQKFVKTHVSERLSSRQTNSVFEKSLQDQSKNDDLKSVPF